MTFKAILAGAILALSTSSTFASDLSDGPGSSGGGNSVNNIFIENYGVSVEDLAGYKTYFQPLMLDLKKYMPYLAEEIMLKAQRTNWYLIPRDIQKLSEKITGLPIESDQVASQGLEEVFIDQQRFDSLVDDKNRGILILHEAILGMYIESSGLLTKDNAKQIMSHVRDTTRAIAGQLYSKDSFEMVNKLISNGFGSELIKHISDQKPVLELNKRYLTEMKNICQRNLQEPKKDSAKSKFWFEQYKLIMSTAANFEWAARDIQKVKSRIGTDFYYNPWRYEFVNNLGRYSDAPFIPAALDENDKKYYFEKCEVINQLQGK